MDQNYWNLVGLPHHFQPSQNAKLSGETHSTLSTSVHILNLYIPKPHSWIWSKILSFTFKHCYVLITIQLRAFYDSQKGQCGKNMSHSFIKCILCLLHISDYPHPLSSFIICLFWRPTVWWQCTILIFLVDKGGSHSPNPCWVITSNPAEGLWQGTSLGTFKSKKIQNEPGLLLWRWGPSYLA